MTKAGETPHRRYDEGCIAAHALDLIGDRWALLVVRELMLGAKRFGALRAGLPGVSANILTKRLGDLERAGVVTRYTLPPPANVQVYALTRAGLGLRPVINALCRWGAGMPGHDPRLFISPTALMLSMRAMIDRTAARRMAAAVGFALGDEQFAAHLEGGALVVERVEQAVGEVVLSGKANAMAAAVYGPLPLADTAASGAVTAEGDLALGQRFLDLFSLRRG